jgi:hypothetical protein
MVLILNDEQTRRYSAEKYMLAAEGKAGIDEMNDH